MPAILATPVVRVTNKQYFERGESEEGGRPLPSTRQSSTVASSTTTSSTIQDGATVIAVRVLEAKQWSKPDRPPNVYRPNSSGSQHLAHLDLRWQKVILHRFATENGGVVFALGTKFASTVTRDTEDVPASQIYQYVTPAELARFENASYEADAEAERIRLLTMKPRGRPRKHRDGEETGEEGRIKVLKAPKDLKEGGYAAFRDPGQPKKRGRPVGWRKGGAVVGSTTTNAAVPSFNGPQPMGEPSTTSKGKEKESVTPRSSQGRSGMYSMVAASSLGNIEETESESDDQGLELLTPMQASTVESSGRTITAAQEYRISQTSSARSESLGPIEDELDYMSAPVSPARRQPSTIPNSQPSRSRDSSIDILSTEQPVASAEDERRRLLGLFTSRLGPVIQSRPRSHVSDSSVDSLLPGITVNVPASQLLRSHPQAMPRVTNQPQPSQPTKSSPNPTTLTSNLSSAFRSSQTPPRSLKRKSITPHFPSTSKKPFRPTHSPSRNSNSTQPTIVPPRSPLTARKVNAPSSSRTPVTATKRRGRPPKSEAPAARPPSAKASFPKTSTASSANSAPVRAYISARTLPPQRQQPITAFISAKTLPVHAKPPVSAAGIGSKKPTAEELLTQAVRRAGKKEVIEISSSSDEEEDDSFGEEDEDEAPALTLRQATQLGPPITSEYMGRRNDAQEDDDSDDFSPVRTSPNPPSAMRQPRPDTQFIDPRLVMRRRDENHEGAESESEDSLIDERFIIRKR